MIKINKGANYNKIAKHALSFVVVLKIDNEISVLGAFTLVGKLNQIG